MDETEGKLAVEFARRSVENEVSGTESEMKNVPESFQNKRGVFVTLKTYPQDELRGCIGFPEPVYPLLEALDAAARYACHDPRFPDLRASETNGVTIEVSILTVPEIMDMPAEQRPQNIEIGKDGLIVEIERHRGLLLPQVAPEWGWNAEEFLAQTCRKAGLAAASWKNKEVTIYKFQAEIFSEMLPGGEIRRQS